MNYQTKAEELQALTETEARSMLLCRYPDDIEYYQGWSLQYYATPYSFSTTAGPFSNRNIFAGQAFTTWTIEAWVIDSGEITLPKGLTGEQRREWIKKNLEESFLIIPGLLFEVKK